MNRRPFSTTVTEQGPHRIIAVTGHLDAHTAPDFEETLRGLLAAEENRIIVDFGDLVYISSAGLGVFMGIIEEVRADGGDIKLTAMSDEVYDIFELLGFPLFYDILPDSQAAIDRFSTGEAPGSLVAKGEEG